MTPLPPKPPEPSPTPSSEHQKPSPPQSPQDLENSERTSPDQATSPTSPQLATHPPTPSNLPPNIPPHVLAQLTGQRGGFSLPFGGNPTPFLIPVQAQQAQASLQVWQGQYPPPEAVERYEKVLSGSFNRIIGMTERLQAAQIQEAEQIRLYTYSDGRRGHWLGFSTTVLAMVGAAFCAYMGSPIVAGFFLSVPVISVAKSFIESARKEKPSDIVKAVTQGNPASENAP